MAHNVNDMFWWATDDGTMFAAEVFSHLYDLKGRRCSVEELAKEANGALCKDEIDYEDRLVRIQQLLFRSPFIQVSFAAKDLNNSFWLGFEGDEEDENTLDKPII